MSAMPLYFIDSPHPYETPEDDFIEHVPTRDALGDYCVLPDDDEMPF